MKKNFTQLITNLTQTKKYVIALTSLMILAGSVYLMAAISQIPIQSVTVTADKANNGLTPGFTPLADIVITEGNSKDFYNSSGSFTLTPPAGWQFNGSGTVTAVANSNNITNITVNSNATSIVVSFGINNPNAGGFDQITIRGVEVQALNGAVLYNNSPVILSSSFTNIGLPATVAHLTQTYGAARKLAFSTQPTGTNIYVAISPAPTVLVQDYFGNTVANANNNVTLAIKNNPSGGVLGGTKTVVAMNGIATFSGLFIDAAGSGYTMEATSGSLTATTSNSFNITSRTPSLNAITTCVTEGGGDFLLTITGSNFDRNAVGRINGVDRATTFVSANEVRIAVLATDIATAGAKAVTVVNPGNLSATQNLTVNPSFNNATIAGKTTVCTEEQVVYSAPTGFTGYSWIVSEGASVVVTSGATATIKYNNTAPSSGKVTVQVAATNTCGVRGNTAFEVAVNQTPAAVLSAASATTFCQGSSVLLTASEAPAGQPAYSYEWYNGTTQVGTNSSTYTASATGNYTVVVSAPNGCSKTSNLVAVSVTPTISQGAVAGTTNYCQNAQASALSSTLTGGGSAALTYLWEQSATGTDNWVNAAGTNNQANYTPLTTSAGTVFYRRTVSGGGCVSVGEPIAITVTPAIQNVISGTQSVCSGSAVATLTGTFSGGAPGDVAYLWEQSATGTGNWAAATNSPNDQAIYTPETRTLTTNTSTSTYYRRRVISGNCTSYSNPVTVTVTALPVAKILEGANTYFCPPGSAALSAEAGTNYSYTWYKVIDGGNDQVIGNTRLTSTAEEGVYYVKVIDANNCESTSARITVRQTVVGNNIISGTQTICYGESPATINGSTATPGIEGETVLYQWQSSTDGNTFTNITTGGTSEDLVLGAHTADRWYLRIARVGSCSLTSSVVKVTVKPELKLSSTLTPAAICSGTAFSYTPTSTVAGATFSWSRAAVEGISNTAASGNGAINETLVNMTAAPINVTYTYITRGNDCEGVPQNVVVRVNPIPVLSSTLTPAAICSGSAFSYPATSATSGTTFSWVRQAASGITSSGATSGTGNISQTLTNATANPIDVTYSYTLAANGCTNTQDVVVRVNPIPVLSSTLTPAAICSGGTFSYTPTTATANTSISWTRLSATDITSNGAASGTGNISQTLTNSGTAPVNVTYRYTLTANNCSNTQDVVVTVNPKPVLSSTLTPTAICGGSVFNYSPTSSTIGTSFSWSRAAVAGISNTAGSGTGAISETLVNTTTSAVNVTYVYTLTANGCTNTQNVVVSVSPNLQTSFTGEIANNSLFYTGQGTVALTATPTGGTFSGPGVSGNVNNGFIFSPCSAGAGTHTITYKRTTGNCNSTITKTVTVKTTTYTAVSFASPFPICKGQNTEFKAILYRDVIEVDVTDPRHPDHGQWLNETYEIRKSDPKRYWQNFVGVEPLDANGKLQPAPASHIMNQEDLDASTDHRNYKFKYDWYRNTNNIGSGRVTAKSAGLSATDEFYVLISPIVASNLPCNTSTSATRSSSKWLSAPTNYSMTLSAQNPICKGDGVRLIATPNVGFDFSSINLAVNFYIKKAGAPAESEPTILNPQPITIPDTRTNPNDPITYSYDVAPGIIENGDVVSIYFSTDVVKCLTSGDAGSFMTMIVNERPAIATQPTAQTVCAGTTATLSVGATGADLTYQWYKRPANNPSGAGTAVANGGRVSGATTASLNIANATASDAGLYYVVVGGFCPPTVQSNTIELIVNPVTLISNQPVGNVICPGASHTFVVEASGTNVTYQWYKGTTLLTNGTTNSYTVSNVTAADAGDYKVVVTGTCGEISSAIATLVVNQVPLIATQPASKIICEGGATNFDVSASGTGLSYQWQKNGQDIPNATGSTLNLNNVQTQDAGEYRVIVSGTCTPSTTSEVAVLTVNTVPRIVNQPKGVEVCAGEENIAFGVTATGTNLTYQWYHNGTAIPNATGATYNVSLASNATSGNYTVEVSGACTPAVTSDIAVLTVNPLPTVTVNSPTTCAGTPVTVTATPGVGTGPFSYTWTVPAGVTNPGNVASFPATVAGTYKVRVTDAKSCVSSEEAISTVTVNPLPEVTVNNAEICANQIANITAVTTNGSGNYTYTWDVPTGAVDPGNRASFTTNVPGAYKVTVTDSEACTSVTQTSTVIVNQVIPVSGDLTVTWIDNDTKWLVEANKADYGVGSRYEWFTRTKATPANEWQPDFSSNTNTLIVSNPNMDLEIQAVVTRMDGICEIYTLTNINVTPLPVELIYFKAEKRGNDVALEWATASEQNNKGFEVQVSDDVKNFRSLGFVESRVVTSSLKQVYTFVDKENGKHGTRYYRLKQVDLDGTSEYSSVKAVNFGTVVANRVKAYPNPFQSEVELSIDAEVAGDVLVTITNATGQQLLQRTIQVAKGANNEKLTLDPNLPRGIYIISTRMGEFTSHFKLLKQ